MPNVERAKTLPIKQFGSFFIVGGTAFSIDAAVLYSLIEFADRGAFEARLISASLAVLTTWFLNRNITFRDTRSGGGLRTLIDHLLATGVGFSFNLAIYWLCIVSFDVFEQQPLFALCIASVLGLLLNFVLAKFWVFRVRSDSG